MFHFVGQMMNMDEIMENLADRGLWKWRRHSLRRRSADAAGSSHRCPEKCKEHGIRTAIETTAFAKPLAFSASRFIANADMIIIDLKTLF